MRPLPLALVLALVPSACQLPADRSEPQGSTHSPLVEIARIDGQPVSADAYQAWLADVYGAKPREEYVSLWLLEREARRRGITVSAAEIDAALEELWRRWTSERLGGDPGALDQELARQGHDRDSYARWFHWEKRRELLAARVIHADRQVSEAAVQKLFEQRYGPGGIQTQVRLLVLTRARLSLELSRDGGGRTLTAAELDQRLMEKARALRARAQAGESFEALVRAESNDLSVRKDGGLCSDNEWRLRGRDFVRAVEAAPLHVVPPPVPNSSGIDLFEVVSKQKTLLEDVRASLVKELHSAPPTLEELTALDQRLRAASRIQRPL